MTPLHISLWPALSLSNGSVVRIQNKTIGKNIEID